MSSKRDYDYSYDSNNSNSNDSNTFARKRKRKSRFSDENEKVFIPGLPTIIPSNLSKQQEEIYILQLQIESLTRRLCTGDLGIPDNPEERSPSPEPIYNTEGKRLNTREFRTRKKFEDERHLLISKMCGVNPAYKPPIDYKPPQTKISEKVMIPQDDYPDINFVGLIIGPRGNTLKSMERETAAKIIIRGKGSVKEGKLARKDGQPLPGEDEPLHAFVTGPNQESVLKAVHKINEVIQKGIELPENMNDLRRSQLRELALLNGTLRENDGPRCTNCGANNHRSWQCPDKPNITNNVFCTNCNGVGHLAKDCKEKRTESTSVSKAKIDEEYLSLMAELGEAPPPNSGTGRTATSILGGPSLLTSTTQPSMTNSGDSSSWSSTNGVPSFTSGNGVATTALTTGASAAASWPGYYDPYTAAAYAMWDPSAWATTAAAAAVPPVPPPPPPPSATSTTSTPTNVDYSSAYADPSNQWSQYAQWYAANAASGGTASSAAINPPPPPPIYPPPPPPPKSS